MRERNIDDWYIELYEDKEYYEANQGKIKEYYEANKNQIKEKKYYEANEDKVSEKRKQRYYKN